MDLLSANILLERIFLFPKHMKTYTYIVMNRKNNTLISTGDKDGTSVESVKKQIKAIFNKKSCSVTVVPKQYKNELTDA